VGSLDAVGVGVFMGCVGGDTMIRPDLTLDDLKDTCEEICRAAEAKIKEEYLRCGKSMSQAAESCGVSWWTVLSCASGRGGIIDVFQAIRVMEQFNT
jgi:hypothetical protein